MKKKLNCIMLVDDNPDDNYFHEREIKKSNPKTVIIAKTSGLAALEYLKTKKEPHPDLIFVDINMPGMNGWEFLLEYNKLSKELQSQVTIIMLSTSDNSTDIAKSKTFSIISDYITKPLTQKTMEDIINKYFK